MLKEVSSMVASRSFREERNYLWKLGVKLMPGHQDSSLLVVLQNPACSFHTFKSFPHFIQMDFREQIVLQWCVMIGGRKFNIPNIFPQIKICKNLKNKKTTTSGGIFFT